MQIQDEKSFKKLFVEPNEYAKHIDKLYSHFKKTNFPPDFEEKYGKIVADQTTITELIGQIFCDDVPLLMKKQAYDRLKNNPLVKKVSSNLRNPKKPNCIVIELKNGIKFAAQEFSDACPSYAMHDPEISSQTRLSKCHQKAIEIAVGLMENDVRAVTGYVCGATTKAKYNHSWIEAVIEGQPVVIDAANNLIMDKDAYYYLNVCEAVSSVRDKDIHADNKKLMNLPDGLIVDGFYLYYRDEIVKDLEKNRSFFEQE